MKITITVPTLIAHLMQADNKPYLSVRRLQNAMYCINAALHKQGIADGYNLAFNVSPAAIEQAVLCNNRAFDLDPDGDLIYARQGIEVLTQQYPIDSTTSGIIKVFASGQV